MGPGRQQRALDAPKLGFAGAQLLLDRAEPGFGGGEALVGLVMRASSAVIWDCSEEAAD